MPCYWGAILLFSGILSWTIGVHGQGIVEKKLYYITKNGCDYTFPDMGFKSTTFDELKCSDDKIIQGMDPFPWGSETKEKCEGIIDVYLGKDYGVVKSNTENRPLTAYNSDGTMLHMANYRLGQVGVNTLLYDLIPFPECKFVVVLPKLPPKQSWLSCTKTSCFVAGYSSIILASEVFIGYDQTINANACFKICKDTEGRDDYGLNLPPITRTCTVVRHSSCAAPVLGRFPSVGALVREGFLTLSSEGLVVYLKQRLTSGNLDTLEYEASNYLMGREHMTIRHNISQTLDLVRQEIDDRVKGPQEEFYPNKSGKINRMVAILAMCISTATIGVIVLLTVGALRMIPGQKY